MKKDILKKILAPLLFSIVRDIKHKIVHFFVFYYDFKRYYYYSVSRRRDERTKLIAEIIRDYHVLEKGLTMPETRLGFGRERVLKLSSLCNFFDSKFGREEPQLLQAIAVLKEYKLFHFKKNYPLDDFVLNELELVELKFKSTLPSKQKSVSKAEYFKNTNSSFDLFSNSRSSIRNFTNEDVSIDRLNLALNLARNTPSACNRQSSRVYVFSNMDKIKEILQVQGGNRGFGHLTNKLIVITSETAVFFNSQERNEAFVDGGMYAMNVLYALHHNEIAACTLNCSHTPQKDRLMRKLCCIKKSEVFIGMIACGIPPKNFSIATSKRNTLDEFVKIMN
ncbi:MAG: nitroreductase family protein [Bacteroidales bacterium]|nr:nitroreductase family protein [Bacteroidales bacterium]